MPYTGHDALEAATAILTALYDWRKRLTDKVSTIEGIGSPQCTVGLIEGGINTNVVPDRVSFRLDRRMIPEESPADVERELRDLIKGAARNARSEEHTSELQSLMRISYAVFCLKKKKKQT